MFYQGEQTAHTHLGACFQVVGPASRPTALDTELDWTGDPMARLD